MNRRTSRALGLSSAFIVVGCGGGADHGAEPQSPTRGGGDAGEECLHAANVKREKPKEPGPIGLSHILVRHRELDRADESITRSRAEACLRAVKALDALKGGKPWNEVVTEYSDERGAAERGGSLGTVSEDMLDRDFAAAAYELEPDQISYVVETPRGFHVIHRLH